MDGKWLFDCALLATFLPQMPAFRNWGLHSQGLWQLFAHLLACPYYIWLHENPIVWAYIVCQHKKMLLGQWGAGTVTKVCSQQGNNSCKVKVGISGTPPDLLCSLHLISGWWSELVRVIGVGKSSKYLNGYPFQGIWRVHAHEEGEHIWLWNKNMLYMEGNVMTIMIPFFGLIMLQLIASIFKK